MKQILIFGLAGLLGSAFAAQGALADGEEEHFILLEEENDEPSDADKDATTDEEDWEKNQEEAFQEGMRDRYEDVQTEAAQMPEAAEDVENDSILTGAEVEEENEGGD